MLALCESELGGLVEMAGLTGVAALNVRGKRLRPISFTLLCKSLIASSLSVSYTHLTLPTNREV